MEMEWPLFATSGTESLPFLGALQFAKDKVNNEWNEPSVCHFGDFCDYAHTNMEVLYHPELYKTRMCQVRQQMRSRAMVSLDFNIFRRGTPGAVAKALFKY
jgi:hypothetical protein